jgi:hypothetical protein
MRGLGREKRGAIKDTEKKQNHKRRKYEYIGNKKETDREENDALSR